VSFVTTAIFSGEIDLYRYRGWFYGNCSKFKLHKKIFAIFFRNTLYCAQFAVVQYTLLGMIRLWSAIEATRLDWVSPARSF